MNFNDPNQLYLINYLLEPYGKLGTKVSSYLNSIEDITCSGYDRFKNAYFKFCVLAEHLNDELDALIKELKEND